MHVVVEKLKLLSRDAVTWDLTDFYKWNWTAPFPSVRGGCKVCVLTSIRMIEMPAGAIGTHNPAGVPYGYALANYPDRTLGLLTYPPTFGDNPVYENPDPREKIVWDWLNGSAGGSWLDGHPPWDGVLPYVTLPYSIYDHNEGFGAGPYWSLSQGLACPPFASGESGTYPFIPSPYGDHRLNGVLRNNGAAADNLADGPSFSWAEPNWRSTLQVDGRGCWLTSPWPSTIDYHFYGEPSRVVFPVPLVNPPYPRSPIRWVIADARLIFIIIGCPGEINAGQGPQGIRARHRIHGQFVPMPQPARPDG